MEDKRFAINTLLVGFTGTGKTSRVIEAIEGKPALFYSFAPNDKAMREIPIIASDDLDKVSGERNFYRLNEFMNYKKTLFNIATKYFNGNIIFDDISQIMSSNISREFKGILTQVRHNGNDIFFMFHHINQVPPFLYEMVGQIMVFKMQDVSFEKSTGKMPRVDEFTKAANWVKTAKNPHAYAFLVTDPVNKRSTQPFIKVENP